MTKRQPAESEATEQAPAGRVAGGSVESAAPPGSDGLPDPLGAVVEAIGEHKGTDLLVLDLRGIASFADALVICNGRSERHVQSLADAIIQHLEERGTTPLHTEGYEQGSWILVDYVDFLVNVFTPEVRDFYQLERVWRDAPVLAGERLHAAEEQAREQVEEPTGDEVEEPTGEQAEERAEGAPDPEPR